MKLLIRCVEEDALLCQVTWYKQENGPTTKKIKFGRIQNGRVGKKVKGIPHTKAVIIY